MRARCQHAPPIERTRHSPPTRGRPCREARRSCPRGAARRPAHSAAPCPTPWAARRPGARASRPPSPAAATASPARICRRGGGQKPADGGRRTADGGRLRRSVEAPRRLAARAWLWRPGRGVGRSWPWCACSTCSLPLSPGPHRSTGWRLAPARPGCLRPPYAGGALGGGRRAATWGQNKQNRVADSALAVAARTPEKGVVDTASPSRAHAPEQPIGKSPGGRGSAGRAWTTRRISRNFRSAAPQLASRRRLSLSEPMALLLGAKSVPRLLVWI
jgi:hypothetical protein